MLKFARHLPRFAAPSLLCLALSGPLIMAPAAHAQSGVPALDAALRAEVALVVDIESGSTLYAKNSDNLRPIASISKLMAALVVVESGLPMDEVLSISDEDVGRMRFSRSRLAVGTRLTR